MLFFDPTERNWIHCATHILSDSEAVAATNFFPDAEPFSLDGIPYEGATGIKPNETKRKETLRSGCSSSA